MIAGTGIDGANGTQFARERCLHCQGIVVWPMPRGLCRDCYYQPSIRARYPSLATRGAERGSGIGGCNGAREHWLPTSELPGTEGKLRVLEQRAADAVPLFHPRDARLEGVLAADWLTKLMADGYA